MAREALRGKFYNIHKHIRDGRESAVEGISLFVTVGASSTYLERTSLFEVINLSTLKFIYVCTPNIMIKSLDRMPTP